MIFVDSSVWIDFFNGADTAPVRTLDASLGADVVATGDLIVAEVLQGFRQDNDFNLARKALSCLPLFFMVGPQIAVASARNYRRVRAEGITIRKTMDMLIATFCIENTLPLLHADKDFDRIASILNLDIVSDLTV